MAGDFNDTTSSTERRSSAPENDADRNRKFKERIDRCSLIDMGSSGPGYTWTNGRQGLANTQKRLDRALCNAEWRALFPEAGVKLNTDGCMYLTNDKAGFGGLFRDHMGKWLLGYYGKIRSTSSLETELVGIYRGLTIMHEKGYQNVQVESDSMEAVKLVNEGNAIGHPHQALIQDANVLLRGT